MDNIGIIDPAEDEECCACGTENVRLTKFVEEFAQIKEHQHCALCFASLCGKVCEYPKQFENRDILQTICAVGNLILKELRRI